VSFAIITLCVVFQRVFIVVVVYFVMTRSGNFWIYTRMYETVESGSDILVTVPKILFCKIFQLASRWHMGTIQRGTVSTFDDWGGNVTVRNFGFHKKRVNFLSSWTTTSLSRTLLCGDGIRTSPNSLDLVLYNVSMYPKLKICFRQSHFEWPEGTQSHVTRALKGLSENCWQPCFMAWRRHWVAHTKQSRVCNSRCRSVLLGKRNNFSRIIHLLWRYGNQFDMVFNFQVITNCCQLKLSNSCP